MKFRPRSAAIPWADSLVVMTVVLSTLTKVLLASLGISLAIKYGGPYLPLTGTSATAAVIVVAPSILLAIALGWDAWSRR